MQVAVDLRQVPFGGGFIDRGMQNERGRDRTAERRLAPIPWIVVTGARDIGRDHLGRNRVLENAVIAADIAIVVGEWIFHGALIFALSRSLNFASSMTARL